MYLLQITFDSPCGTTKVEQFYSSLEDLLYWAHSMINTRKVCNRDNHNTYKVFKCEELEDVSKQIENWK